LGIRFCQAEEIMYQRQNHWLTLGDGKSINAPALARYWNQQTLLIAAFVTFVSKKDGCISHAKFASQM